MRKILFSIVSVSLIISCNQSSLQEYYVPGVANTVIRFDSIYSFAKVLVNDNYIRDHSGGFAGWECDIAPHVKPVVSAFLCVVLTDMSDETSYRSGYVKHPMERIFRSIKFNVASSSICTTCAA
ncbi:MAG: hypothetical protein AMS23_10290 [Bacteroides sp. SM1_62]|nr:MAG: hypothetical protein AMS26_06935 [Bacteroides sp. SM23_62]KPL20840.1 MAG: hypothetical protein AMS23_10290 [Bacteroides sp. SM1_62]